MNRFASVAKRPFSFIANYRTIYRYSILINPGTTLSGFFKRRKFEIRAFIFYDDFMGILELFDNSKLRVILSANARILDKVLRKYLIHDATSKERFSILRSNYLFVRDNFSNRLIQSVFLNHDFPLCRLELPIQKMVLFARLTSLPKFEKEGEMTLGLFQEGGRRLYSVTFSISVRDDVAEVIIGCILGPDKASGNEESDKQLVRDLTKEMHGGRPKKLVLLLLQVFCRYFNISRLLAVAFDAHIYGGDPARRSRISTDYDEFWQELGGERQGRFYSLPLTRDRRTYEEIPSKKRAEYARRYSLLESLEDQMIRALNEINSD